MYHYVRPAGQTPAGIRPLSLEGFERQLDELERSYQIVGPDEYVADGDRRRCLLTFDDGTRDHVEVVLPVLARRGLTGVFFLLTGPWTSGKLPTAHRVHALLSHATPESLLEALRESAATRGVDDEALGAPAEAARVYHYEDSAARARLKYALNFALPPGEAGAILDDLVAWTLGDERSLASAWFAGPEDAQQLHTSGMTVAAHGETHEALARLTPDDVEREIRRCHDTLTSVVGEPPRWFAPPFGGVGAGADTVARMLDVLRSLDYAGYCTAESGMPGKDGALWRIGRWDAASL